MIHVIVTAYLALSGDKLLERDEEAFIIAEVARVLTGFNGGKMPQVAIEVKHE